jgi:uncharacterized lipoprotein YddW (UPF0748 family)
LDIRGVWISYVELTQKAGTTKTQFKTKYAAIFAQYEEYGLTDVFLHVRAASDAFYKSKRVPWSSYLTGTQGADPGYDPLAILLDLAHKYNLRLHAWINPFRVGGSDLTKYAQSNPARKHISANDGWVRKADNGYYWNPAKKEARANILEDVKELLKAYKVDGIHIDDYFYPTTNADFDAPEYKAYQSGGGKLDLDDWRRSCVSAFVADFYKTAKDVNKNCIVSISPGGNIDKNIAAYYADVKTWAKDPGYCDWLIPQLYFGFDHATLPFGKTAAQWAGLERRAGLKLIGGLAAYKINTPDSYAKGGTNEWQLCTNVLARQAAELTQYPYSGFVLYSTSSLFGAAVGVEARTEKKNLLAFLESH